MIRAVFLSTLILAAVSPVGGVEPADELAALHDLYAPDEPRHRWTEQDSKNVQKLRADNLSMRDIADIMACSTSSVQKALRGEP